MEGGGLRHTVAENLAGLYPMVIWKAELVRNELGYLAQEIYERSVEGVACIIFVLYSTM